MDNESLLEGIKNNELVQFLGIKLVEASADSVVLTMEVTPKVHQYVGIMNGGISLYLAETAASVGAVVTADLSKVTPVGVEINANHIRAVSKGLLTITAKPVFAGRTMAVWQTDIVNEKGKLVCTSRCTLLLQRRPAFRQDQGHGAN